MTAKDFLNVKKPHFWTALAVIIVLGLAGSKEKCKRIWRRRLGKGCCASGRASK